jgi:uracil-DNA glycosylase family 4
VGSPGGEAAAILTTIAAAVRGCTRCRLHGTRTVAVPGEGPAETTIFLIGEAPGKDEDLSGRPFVGRAGRILDRALDAAGLARDSVFVTNVVKCRPPGNRKPKSDERDACRLHLLAEIRAVQPRIIVTLGSTALRGLMGPGLSLQEARDRSLQFGGVPVKATYHPAAVLYNRNLEGALRRDLRKVARASKLHSVRDHRART